MNIQDTILFVNAVKGKKIVLYSWDGDGYFIPDGSVSPNFDKMSGTVYDGKRKVFIWLPVFEGLGNEVYYWYWKIVEEEK
jgi:hypothetical protein